MLEEKAGESENQRDIKYRNTCGPEDWMGTSLDADTLNLDSACSWNMPQFCPKASMCIAGLIINNTLIFLTLISRESQDRFWRFRKE